MADENDRGSGGGSLYFVVGNGWLLFALLLYLCQVTVTTEPWRYAFLHNSFTWLTVPAYYTVVGACLGMAAFCFGLHLTRR